MAVDLSPAAIPLVLDEGELPFVLGLAADKRRCLVVGKAEYRRGHDRVSVAWRLGPLRLRAVLLHAAGGTYLMASAGTILNEWWPLLRREGPDAARPLLSAGVASRPQPFISGDLDVAVSIVPAGPDLDATTTVVAVAKEASLSEGSVLVAHALSLGVIKAALMLLEEYRTLVVAIPDIAVESDGLRLQLPKLLDSARDASAAVNWTHTGG